MYVISTLVELIAHTVKEYLEHNKRIVVPRLGTFIVKPDGETIVFSELMRNDDGVLRSLLTSQGLGELEIDGMIDRMIFNIRHAAGNGREYAIDGFGSFMPGANGTIRFTDSKTGGIIHGYIKPAIPLSDNPDRRKAKAPITAIYDQTEEPAAKMSRSHIANPDPYLRGLKYDKHKKSEREGSIYVMTGGREPRRHNMLIAVAAAIAVICAASYLFINFHDNPPTEEAAAGNDTPIPTADPKPEEIDDVAAGESDSAATPQEQPETTAPPDPQSDLSK